MAVRGQLAIDLLYAVIVLATVGIGIFFIVKVYSGMNSNMQELDTLSTDSKVMLAANSGGYGSLWDGLLVLAYGLVWVFLLVSSYFVNSHPIFLVFTLLILIFIFIVVMVIGNVYQAVADSPQLVSESSQFPMTLWIYTHLLEMSIVEAFTCLIALFARSPTSGGGV